MSHQTPRGDAPPTARRGRVLVASLEERRQIRGGPVRQSAPRAPGTPGGAGARGSLWTPRGAPAAGGSAGLPVSPRGPADVPLSLFCSPDRAAERSGRHHGLLRPRAGPGLPDIHAPRSLSQTMPARTTSRPFFPGAEPSPRRILSGAAQLSESSDDDSHHWAEGQSRPTTSEGQTSIRTTPRGVAELSSSFQSWGFASLRSLSFSDGEVDEAPRDKPRTSTASLGES